MEAPDGQGIGVPWTAWAISALACRVRRSLAAWVSSCVARNLPRTVAKAAIQGNRQTLPARPPPKAASVAVRAPSPCLQVQALCGRFEGWGQIGVEKVYDVEFAATSTRTGSGNKFTSRTSGTITLNRGQFYLNRLNTEFGAGKTIQIDDVRYSNTGWPP